MVFADADADADADGNGDGDAAVGLMKVSPHISRSDATNCNGMSLGAD